jgi:limonene-1,2-epoxide hydrolase
MTNVEIAETYLSAMGTKDPTKALLAPDATLQYPLTPRTVVGAASVREYMSSFMPAVDEVRIERHLTDGDYVVTLWQAHTVWGIIPVCSVFRISEGMIQEVRAFFDPRPIAPLG